MQGNKRPKRKLGARKRGEMTSIQQIALQLSGGFLAGVCVWLWLERKRRIRRAKELKRLDAEIAGLLRRLKEVNAEIEVK